MLQDTIKIKKQGSTFVKAIKSADIKFIDKNEMKKNKALYKAYLNMYVIYSMSNNITAITSTTTGFSSSFKYNYTIIGAYKNKNLAYQVYNDLDRLFHYGWDDNIPEEERVYVLPNQDGSIPGVMDASNLGEFDEDDNSDEPMIPSMVINNTDTDLSLEEPKPAKISTPKNTKISEIWTCPKCGSKNDIDKCLKCGSNKPTKKRFFS